MGTHTYNIEANSLNLEGEATFNSGKPQIEGTWMLDVPQEELKAFLRYMEETKRFFDACGGILKNIEIKEKP